MATNVTWNGTTYSIPAAGEVGWSALSNFLIALGNGAAVAEEMKQAVRVATTSPVTVSDTTDCVVVTDLGTPGAVAVNLPSGTAGRFFFIIDGKGDAATNNITITPSGGQTIGGAASLVLTNNRDAVVLVYSSTGSDWKVIGPVTRESNMSLDDIGGTLSISKGGTGQTSKTPAFDALSPTTTKGDLIAYDGTDNVRLAVGTNGQVLQADSTQATGLKWADSGSGGAGELNVITNPSAASATTGWTAGANHTVTRITASSPLDPTVSTALQLAASASTAESSTSGVYWPIATMPAALLNKKLKVEFYVTVPSSDVWRLSVYAGATRLALTTDSSSVTTLPAGFTGKFTAYFDTTSATAYSVNFTKTTHTSGNNLIVTSVIVGPGIQPQGAVVTEWQSYTPTGTWSANVTYTGKWRRVGDTMEIDATVATSGAPTSAALEVNIPTGYTIDTSKLTNAAVGETWFGSGTVRDDGVASYDCDVEYASTTALKLRVIDSSSTYATRQNVTQAVPITFGSGDTVTLRATVPIAEWAGSGTLNVAQNDVEYAYNSNTADANDTTSFAYGPDGVAIGSYTTARQKTVRFQTPIQTTDELIIEVKSANGPWTPISIADGSTGLGSLSFQNANSYGIGILQGSSTSQQVVVVFGSYAYPNGATYGAAGAAWSGYTAYKWRVKKMAGGQAVGFGAATSTFSGLVSTTTQTFAGVKTFSSGIALPNGGTTLDYFVTGSFTATFTQAGGYSQAVTVQYQRIGNLVILNIPTFSATTTATATINSGATDVPAAARPAIQYRGVVCVQGPTTGVYQVGQIDVTTGGQIQLASALNGASFTTGNTCGLGGGGTTVQTILYRGA